MKRKEKAHIVGCPQSFHKDHDAYSDDCICEEHDRTFATWRADLRLEQIGKTHEKTQDVPKSFEALLHEVSKQNSQDEPQR